MKLVKCAKLQRRATSGTWFRALEPQHLQTSLATAHTPATLSRFSGGSTHHSPFEILYLTSNPQVALWEVGAIFGSPYDPGNIVPHPRKAWTIVNVQVTLQQVADLTVVSQQQLLGTTVQELTGDWKGYSQRQPGSAVPEPVGLSPTQELGEALFSIPGLEGFFTVSAKVPISVNLIVFPSKLEKGSSLEFRYDPLGIVEIIDHRSKKRQAARSP